MSVAGPEMAFTAAGQLNVLAQALGAQGFVAQIMRVDGKACVRVFNRVAKALTEVVCVAPAADGSWWFWWSWGDRVAPIGDIETAAFKIAYVLTPTS